MSDDVILIDREAIQWPFHSGHGGPIVSLPPTVEGAWHSSEAVDPFPAYAHDVAVVSETLEIVKRLCPLAQSPVVYVLSHETPSRTNGWAEPVHRYVDGEQQPAPGKIVLPGKRVPPHPAMTRYVTAHEYGHHVEFQFCRQRGVKPGDDAVRREYAELRGCAESVGLPYGGGTWHASIGELLANDFRILIADVETEFWPHPGFPRPEEVAGIASWWHEALDGPGAT